MFTETFTERATGLSNILGGHRWVLLDTTFAVYHIYKVTRGAGKVMENGSCFSCVIECVSRFARSYEIACFATSIITTSDFWKRDLFGSVGGLILDLTCDRFSLDIY